MEHFRIRNWQEFQHYKDRNPPWIKLHRELLNSRTWVALDDASRVLAIAIMLIASENNNEIPLDPGFIQRRAFLSGLPDLEPLFSIGFIELCSEEKTPLANASKCYQNDSASVSVSSNSLKRKTSKKRAKKSTEIPDGFGVSERVRSWAGKKGFGSLDAHLEYFTGYAKAHGKTYRDWDQAFINCIRDDWGGVRKGKGASDWKAKAYAEAAQ